VNGRERLLMALEVRQPDRGPVWIHAINEIAVVDTGRVMREGVPEAKTANLMSQEEMPQLLDLLFVIHERLGIDTSSFIGPAVYGRVAAEAALWYEAQG